MVLNLPEKCNIMVPSAKFKAQTFHMQLKLTGDKICDTILCNIDN